MTGAGQIAARVVQKFRRSLAASPVIGNWIEKRWLRIRDLQAANAYQLHVIRLLQAELAAKRAENATYLKQINRRSEDAASVQEENPTTAARSSDGRSTPFRSVGALLTEGVKGPLVDLGDKIPQLKGVLSLERHSEMFSADRSEKFRDQAEVYSRAFQTHGYIQGLYANELRNLGITPSGLVVDFHPSSSSTVAPLVSSYTDLSVVAVGTEPFELAALLKAAAVHGIADRCVAIASEADRDLFRGEVADFVFGGTMLHQLVDPKLLLKRAIEVLKPGGSAIFFAPFEDGHAILRLAYDEIIREAKVRNLGGAGFDFLRSLAADIAARSQRQHHPDLSTRWFELESKWLFCKSDLEQYCLECGATAVYVRPFNHPTKPFTAQTRSSLENYGGLAANDALPGWAWNMLRRYDDEAFSQDLLRDLVIEGSIVITK